MRTILAVSEAGDMRRESLPEVFGAANISLPSDEVHYLVDAGQFPERLFDCEVHGRLSRTEAEDSNAQLVDATQCTGKVVANAVSTRHEIAQSTTKVGEDS